MQVSHPIPKTMIAPGQKRPSIWRSGIIQIMITRACDLSCHHCSQGSNLAGKPAMMSPDQFAQACDSLAGYFGVVGMFGGNPALHPKFDTLCSIMRDKIPYLQRGLWCNNLNGHGESARITFNPRHSNLNVHLASDAYGEFSESWPESIPYLKGLTVDSVHSSPWVSMTDIGIPEEKRWELIGECDINRYWSALIGVIRGELRAFFCEIAYAQAALHEQNQNWAGTGRPMPDTGHDVVPGWWRRPMEMFRDQVETHCHHCGIPMRREGQQAIGGEQEEFSQTHWPIARPKVRERQVNLIESIGMMGRRAEPATNYLPGTTPGY